MSVQSRATNRIIIGSIAAFLLLIVGAVVLKQSTPAKQSTLSGRTAIVYHSPTCGCCGNYVRYLKGYGISVEEKLVNDTTAVKQQFGVPQNLTSCHTMEIGGYTVEGHVPVEAIEKLMKEKPAIAGIGMPGMPSGSPGMPGAKYGTFDVRSFNADGSVAPFVSL